MGVAVPDSPVQGAEPARRAVIPPSEALSRFEPPEGFVPVATETVEKSVRYGFRSAGLALLIRQGVGSEVVPMMAFASIPNGPAWLLGIINLRGNLVPVCDLRRVLGESAGAAAAAAKTMILVLDKGEKAAGFVIDGYPCALAGLRAANQVPGLPEPLVRHVQAAFATDEEVWLEFDHEGFLEGSSRQ